MTYDVTVTAATRKDAIDIARRRAWDDGFRHAGTARVVSVPGSTDRWAVTLEVVRR